MIPDQPPAEGPGAKGVFAILLGVLAAIFLIPVVIMIMLAVWFDHLFVSTTMGAAHAAGAVMKGMSMPAN
jgi:uncharacterized membrane protein